ncbi:MAG: DUF494 family protein [Bacteroidetes bacterium]|nr:DUF494 family protein [Bacteroidota bacterium]MBX7045281.1 DUF494 domain-containing protein [Ignavibacteria bacterium]
MQEKILEIIVHILSQIKSDKHLNDIDVAALSQEGYTDAEINSAFAWIYSKIEQGENLFIERNKTSKSHRFFHPAEKSIISNNAIGYLIQLKELGLISDLDEELIIDRIFFLGYQKAGIPEIQTVLTTLIFNFDGKSEKLERLILQNNETIH